MLEFFGKKNVFRKKEEESLPDPPFSFGHTDVDSYQYPNLYEEADEMLQISILIYR